MSVHLSGDPALLLLPPEATVADYEQMRANLGLDRPIIVQYGTFLLNAVQGDFGKSITTRRPARDVLFERIVRLPGFLLLWAEDFRMIRFQVVHTVPGGQISLSTNRRRDVVLA